MYKLFLTDFDCKFIKHIAKTMMRRKYFSPEEKAQLGKLKNNIRKSLNVREITNLCNCVKNQPPDYLTETFYACIFPKIKVYFNNKNPSIGKQHVAFKEASQDDEEDRLSSGY